MQVKLVWRHFGLKCVFIYDRNTVINTLKKQRVPAPWVIIHLLYRSSHILRTRESYIISICEFHNTLRLKIHFALTEVLYWNKQDRMKLTPFVLNNTWTWRTWNGTSLNSWDKAHAFIWGKWTGWTESGINKQWTDSGEGFGGHVINKFYRSLSSSQPFKPKEAIKKILTKTQKSGMIEARL